MEKTEDVSNPLLNNNEHQEIVRPVGDFPHSIWGDLFTKFTFDKQVYDMGSKEIEAQKKEIQNLITNKQQKEDVDKKLKLIDSIERLGISHHFMKEIKDELHQIYNTKSEAYPLYDLTTASLQFRLLRQNGFSISSGIFNTFMDSHGKLKDSSRNDIKGLLNLYEAAQLRTKEDTILEHNLASVITNLKQLVLACPSNSLLAKQVRHALDQSLHKGNPRTEARYYIAFYEEDISKNEMLLKFAKLDYNLLQMLHRKELSVLLRWWQDVDLVSKLSYARDRLVECYYWALGCYYESCYSQQRVFLAKTISVISLIDDTYDAYGTLDELDILTNALEKWDQKEIDQLPADYMKTCYMALLDLCHEIEDDLANQGKSYAMDLYIETWKEYARFSNIQSKWFLKRDLPDFDEYMKVGVYTSSFNLIMAASMVLMKPATKEVFVWLASTPRIMEATMVIGRLLNDVTSHKFEQERDSGTAIHCYMKNYDVSEEVALVKVEEIGNDAWKDLNEELLKQTSNIPKEVLVAILGLARLSDVCYKHQIDGYTDPSKFLKSHIMWKEYARLSNTQAKWFLKRDIPNFDEYLKLGLYKSGFNLITAGFMVFIKPATKEVIDCLASTPRIMVASMAIGCLRNDVASHKNFGVSKEEALVNIVHGRISMRNGSSELAFPGGFLLGFLDFHAYQMFAISTKYMDTLILLNF